MTAFAINSKNCSNGNTIIVDNYNENNHNNGDDDNNNIEEDDAADGTMRPDTTHCIYITSNLHGLPQRRTLALRLAQS